MEQLEMIKKCLINCAENEMTKMSTHEFGEVIDMIKDLEEAIYYHSITNAMNTNSGSSYRDMDREHGRMYFDGEKKPVMYYTETKHSSSDPRQRYLEAKQNHEDKSIQLKELEAYMNDLSADIVEMIDDASAEERQYLERKMI